MIIKPESANNVWNKVSDLACTILQIKTREQCLTHDYDRLSRRKMFNIYAKKLTKSGLVHILLLSVMCVSQTISPLYGKSLEARGNKKRFERFEKQLDELRRLLKIPAISAIIVKDQKVLWAKGFGYADLEKRIPASPDTPYHIASLTKTFAATVLMQLVEQGKISLDEPIAKYSNDFKDDSVKIKHLLSHTSIGTPGERYQYSGNRYDYLTAVIEKVYDRPFREVLVKNILEPLEMSSSVPGQNILTDKDKWAASLGKEKLNRYQAVLSSLAQPYRLYGTEIVRTPYPPGGIGAAAGLISTVMDLAKYDGAIDRHLFLEKETQEQAWTPFVSNSGKSLPHGLGWFVENYHGLKLIWHFGDWPNSFSALLLKVPEKNLSFYLLANSDALSEPPFYNTAGVEGSPFASTFLRLFVFEDMFETTLPDPHWAYNARRFSDELTHLKGRVTNYSYDSEQISYNAMTTWLAERRAKARKAVKVDPKASALYVGQYGGRADGTGGFIISEEGGGLMVDVPRNGRFEMFPESETSFFLKGMDLQFTFIKDEKGQVTHLDFQADGQKGRVKKVK
jgi:CubicO group peptidase (beta-lactamase class C family)